MGCKAHYFYPGPPKDKHTRELCAKSTRFLWHQHFCGVSGVFKGRAAEPMSLLGAATQHKNTQHMNNLLSIS